jgi:hypothetical protein
MSFVLVYVGYQVLLLGAGLGMVAYGYYRARA